MDFPVLYHSKRFINLIYAFNDIINTMPTDLNKELKKRMIGRWGKYTVFLVDDETIRNKAKYAEEFGDYGVNLGKKGLATANFKFIPENEIWVAKSIRSGERHFVVDNALSYVRNIERGIEPGEAYDKALIREKSERIKDAVHKLHLKKGVSITNLQHKKIAEKIYASKYATIKESNKDNVKIYLVNGEYVRDFYKTDYVEGGHGYVYSWIPKDEIWVDKSIGSKEIPVIILHEYTERTLMKYKKISYVQSHNIALKVEFEHRGIFNRRDISGLNKRFVLDILLREMNC